jgi:hypothetical protein
MSEGLKRTVVRAVDVLASLNRQAGEVLTRADQARKRLDQARKRLGLALFRFRRTLVSPQFGEFTRYRSAFSKAAT